MHTFTPRTRQAAPRHTTVLALLLLGPAPLCPEPCWHRPQVPWGEFFRSPPVWAVTVAHFCFNWGYYTLLAWLPSYFELALGLNVEKSSILTLIPYVAMTCMMPLVGPVADGMVEKGVPLTAVRKICQGIAFVGPAMCMIACALLTPSTPAAAFASAAPAAAGPGALAGATAAAVPVGILVALMSLAFALSAWSRAGLYCNHQDLSPKYAGQSFGWLVGWLDGWLARLGTRQRGKGGLGGPQGVSSRGEGVNMRGGGLWLIGWASGTPWKRPME